MLKQHYLVNRSSVACLLSFWHSTASVRATKVSRHTLISLIAFHQGEIFIWPLWRRFYWRWGWVCSEWEHMTGATKIYVLRVLNSCSSFQLIYNFIKPFLKIIFSNVFLIFPFRATTSSSEFSLCVWLIQYICNLHNDIVKLTEENKGEKWIGSFVM